MLLFTAVDCPISDRYAPEVRRLAARHGADGVRFWLVYANAGETPAAARAHAAAFAYGLPVVLDPAATLADRAGQTVTPEAAVFDAAGRLVYHGRIDDRYVDFGVDRPAPTTHDLADALAAVLAGRPVAHPDACASDAPSCATSHDLSAPARGSPVGGVGRDLVLALWPTARRRRSGRHRRPAPAAPPPR